MKHARMLQNQGEEISENQLQKISKWKSLQHFEKLRYYFMTLVEVTFDILQALGEKLDSKKILIQRIECERNCKFPKRENYYELPRSSNY